MHRFFFCPLIALLVSINSICGSLFFMYSTNLFFNIQSSLFLMDLIFWFFFFKRVLLEKKDVNKIKILLILTLLIATYLLFFNTVDKRNLHIVALDSICKAIFCILFYQSLFKNLTYKNILTEPSFWIVSGVIFYSCLSLPFYGLNSYIKLQFSPLIASNILSISNMLIIIMHLFFIKAYLCTIKVQKA